jgi:hypothetical protein
MNVRGLLPITAALLLVLAMPACARTLRSGSSASEATVPPSASASETTTAPSASASEHAQPLYDTATERARSASLLASDDRIQATGDQSKKILNQSSILSEITEAPAETASSGCHNDDDCAYDPIADRCGTDPRYNRQPPIVDQGIICYCDSATRACTLHRVPPAPCEGDQSCAVRLDPRPHPVRATPDLPHERGNPCRDFLFSTTCERTNICTLHRHKCSAAK